MSEKAPGFEDYMPNRLIGLLLCRIAFFINRVYAKQVLP